MSIDPELRTWHPLDIGLAPGRSGVPADIAGCWADMFVFREAGRTFAIFKQAGDLRAAASEPTLLFRASAASWAKPFKAYGRRSSRVTDGPFLHRLASGILLMLWSTTGHEGYAMGYATSDSSNILGPWRQSDAPIYGRDGGHGMLFRDFDGRLWMTLHHPNDTPNERPLWLAVAEVDGRLCVHGSHPTTSCSMANAWPAAKCATSPPRSPAPSPACSSPSTPLATASRQASRPTSIGLTTPRPTV